MATSPELEDRAGNSDNHQPTFCEACTDCMELFTRGDTFLEALNDESSADSVKVDLNILNQYMTNWVRRQCVCLFRNGLMVERFCLTISNFIRFSVQLLKDLGSVLTKPESNWTAEDIEKVLQFLGRVFLPEFPLYAGPKQVGYHFQEPGAAEATELSAFCDVHESAEYALLRNATSFCKSGGLQGVASSFQLTAATLPLNTAHALTSVLCNIKRLLNLDAIKQCLGPVRENALKYMCSLGDTDLRSQPARVMTQFFWSMKDQLHLPLFFDRDGLALAFKFFTSTTLTMRVYGLNHITLPINLYNEMQFPEGAIQLENFGIELAEWILQNQIVEHLFGPNLHVEVIKHSQVLLNFLAAEAKLTNDHIGVMWQAAQLKHCSKEVHQILLPLIKNLEAGPVLHLFDLLKALPVKEHNEQTIFLAQEVQDFLWRSGGALNLLQETAAMHQQRIQASKTDSSEEDGGSPMPNLSAKKKSKKLMRKSVINSASPDCSFSVNDLEDDFDAEEDMNFDTDDNEEVDEEEDEEDEEEDEDFEHASTDDEDEEDGVTTPDVTSHSSVTPEVPRPGRPILPCPSSAMASTSSPGPRAGQAQQHLRPHVPSQSMPRSSAIPAQRRESKNSDDEVKMCPGKRTKGLPIKGRKRQHEVADTDEELLKEKMAMAKKKACIESGREIQISQSSPSTDGKALPCWWPSTNPASSPPTSGQSPAMTELANLVNAHPRSARPMHLSGQELRDMGPVIAVLAGQRDTDDSPISGGDDSASSRLSDKNMEDFEDDNSVDVEMLQTQEINALLHQQQLAARVALYQQGLVGPRLGARAQNQDARIIAQYRLDDVCEPGNTLLWDLLQDDKIELLAEGLVSEAEKALTELFCRNRKIIRMKFLEGCLSNLKRNKSVAISLRLLPTLIQAFSGAMDSYDVFMSIEKKHNIAQTLFDNLKIYTKEHQEGKKCPFFNHLAQIQIRLHFLTVLFSAQVSPVDFELTVDQLDTLWNCLASDPVCADDLFRYLMLQIHSKHQHAIGATRFKHLYEKLPTLQPEKITKIGLNLFSQLCQVCKDEDSTENNGKMDQLWKIALCAHNTDVSMEAIQILNKMYFGQAEEFLATCMSSLKSAAAELDTVKEQVLIRIQRAILLLKTYLESFRKTYAYQLRRLSIDGQGMPTHAELVEVGVGGSLNLVIQFAGHPEEVPLEMLSSDVVGDLRAEIHAIWGQRKDKSGYEGPLRIFTNGRELSNDLDEKTLMECGFKECQRLLVSQGGMQGSSSRKHVPAFPGRDKMPMNLLLRPDDFDQLFQLMHKLSSLRLVTAEGKATSVPRAQILSRQVWDILMLLPTNPDIKETLQNVAQLKKEDIQQVLSPESPHRLMYTFYIVDWLCRPTRLRRHSGTASTETELSAEATWAQRFIGAGGLEHLFQIFLSGELQDQESTVSCEWRQDCLSLLLKLLIQFGVDAEDFDKLAEVLFDTPSPRKRRTFAGDKSNQLRVPRLSKDMLSLLNDDRVMPRLVSILLDSSKAREASHIRTGFFGRAQVVHNCLNLLVSWLFSKESMQSTFFTSETHHSWLRKLLLEDPDPTVRREVSIQLYKLCMGSTTVGKSGSSCTGPLLSVLISFLDDALRMMPATRKETNSNMTYCDEGKEPFGQACRDYFWIMCRLVDNLHLLSNEPEAVDLDHVARQLACGIVARPAYERRHGDQSPDDALVGALDLLCSACKHGVAFKSSKEGSEFLLQLFEYLFALPNSNKNKNMPKCKSVVTRRSCYDLVIEMIKGSMDNYAMVHDKLLEQHERDSHAPYPWDYWPKEGERADCGYAGITNLGATCYMASCVQQLYMIPQVRDCVLESPLVSGGSHENTFRELKKMFTFLRESERKAYNPLSFCKSYEMNQQTLNTGEQKDMAEFFIDLITKMEEMSSDVRKVIKDLFGGTFTNNVVSLDCNHVSRTLEDFCTVRCQVSGMRTLYQSLEEITVKDTLEGENMFTCSQCNKKVRAEKRASFKSLPKVLAFNTMRYAFNLNTMVREKINTHFSFPFKLDMSPYLEENFLPPSAQKEAEEEKKKKNASEDTFLYELIGVIVHTGTAEGGHYYAFIRDRIFNKDKWYSFNDAEVKPFDPEKIDAECFGGEENSRVLDHMTDRVYEFNQPKTNSAYMLFYERIASNTNEPSDEPSCSKTEPEEKAQQQTSGHNVELSKELEEWIRKDNTQFIQDNNIFDHAYFEFMWQMVRHVPATLVDHYAAEDKTLLSAKLSTSFFLETFIHSKEKVNSVQWVELLTKQFDSSTSACSWLLDKMSSDKNWPSVIFLKCHIETMREMFQRLCMHVIQKLRPSEHEKYLLPWTSKDKEEYPPDTIRRQMGLSSPATRFVRMLLGLLESGAARPHLKYLTELFKFFYDFAKLGEEEIRFLLSIRTISTLVEFYLKAIRQSSDNMSIDIVSDEDDDDDDDIIALPLNETNKMAFLSNMISLIALLVEKSRGEDNLIHLDPVDASALMGSPGKPLVFLFNITKDSLNMQLTCNLIFSLCRNNPALAEQITVMVVTGIKQPDHNSHFRHLLNLLTEVFGGPSGMPCFTNLIMEKVWDLANSCPQAALDWLSVQVSRNRDVQSRLLSTMDEWVESFLLAHNNQKVRHSAALLVVSLVTSSLFRQTFRLNRTFESPHKESMLTDEEAETLEKILEFLFGLLPKAREYVDIEEHGTSKLVAFFQTISHCLLTRKQKLLFAPHFLNLWQLFHPKLSEPSIAVIHNKQSLLNLWYCLCYECPENVDLILQNPHVCKNIAFNYILADHDDSEVINFNRMMLPPYYGILRLCCERSREFTRKLAQHQNIQWAFKHITPYHTQYTIACEELFKLMALFVQIHDDMSEEEENTIRNFKNQTLQLYLTTLQIPSSWNTLINVLKILVKTDEDRIIVLYKDGLTKIFFTFNMLHVMFHEATACHVSQEVIDLIQIFQDLLKAAHNKPLMSHLSRWKHMSEMTIKLLTLCNSFTRNEMREVCIGTVKEMLRLWPKEMLKILVPLLNESHTHASASGGASLGPYFPRKGKLSLLASIKPNVRPPRPMLQMSMSSSQLESSNGVDPDYDKALQKYFLSYHLLVDLMVRLAVNEDCFSKALIDLSAIIGLDGVPLHFELFPKLWLDIYKAQNVDRKFITMLLQSHGFLEYIDAILLDERNSLNQTHVFDFLMAIFPQVAQKVLTDQMQTIISDILRSFVSSVDNMPLDSPNFSMHLNGDLRALLVVSTAQTELLTQDMHQALAKLKVRLEKAQQVPEDQGDTDSETEKKNDSQQQASTSSAGAGEEKMKKKKDLLTTVFNTVEKLLAKCLENEHDSSSSTPMDKDMKESD